MRLAIVLVTSLLVACKDQPAPASGTAKIEVPAQGAVTVRTDFSGEGQPWEFAEGSWQQHDGVLAQTATDRAFPVALWKNQRFSDVDISVRFKPISGRIDASGGIVFRARDAADYYVVRANSLESNFRLYTVIDGDRSKIAGAEVARPTLGEWHTLRVVAVGPHIQAYLDDHLLLDHRDETFASGWVGLWTKADAVTDFDDLSVRGTPASS